MSKGEKQQLKVVIRAIDYRAINRMPFCRFTPYLGLLMPYRGYRPALSPKYVYAA